MNWYTESEYRPLKRGLFLCEHESFKINRHGVYYYIDNMACEPPGLIGRVMLPINAWIGRLAERAERVGCSAGFGEWAYDVGPFTFIDNHSDDCWATQLQVFGHSIITIEF